MLRKRKRKTIPTTAEGPEKYQTSLAARVGEETSSSCCTSEEINFRPRHRWSHSGLPRGQSDIWEPARVPQPPQSSGWTKWKLGLIPDPTSRGSPYQQAGDRWPSALLVVGTVLTVPEGYCQQTAPLVQPPGCDPAFLALWPLLLLAVKDLSGYLTRESKELSGPKTCFCPAVWDRLGYQLIHWLPYRVWGWKVNVS